MQMDGSDLPPPEVPRVPARVGGVNGDWRVERARLEQRHIEAVRRRKPRFLSFAKTSAMVQPLGLSTEDEWLEWLELGEGWSPYVPRDPKSYYEERGTWLGWRIWLTGGDR